MILKNPDGEIVKESRIAAEIISSFPVEARMFPTEALDAIIRSMPEIIKMIDEDATFVRSVDIEPVARIFCPMTAEWGIDDVAATIAQAIKNLVAMRVDDEKQISYIHVLDGLFKSAFEDEEEVLLIVKVLVSLRTALTAFISVVAMFIAESLHKQGWRVEA